MSKIETKVTVANAISELLYQHDNVIVPKFGGFVKEYRASTFDYVQGKISPPSSTVSFNENLKVDDGLLVDFYKRENKVSLQEAKKDIEQFSKKAKVTLANREVVSLPKIGRLLKDYENQTKFISQNHNFNTDTFGLSEVRYYPILREIPQNEENVPSTAAAAKTAAPATIRKERRSQKIAKIAIPLVIILMLTSAFFVFKKFSNNDELASTETEIREGAENDATKIPVNIKPPSKDELDYSHSEDVGVGNEEGIADNSEEIDGFDNASNDGIVVMEEETPEPSTLEEPESTAATIYSHDIIFVGLFGKQSGVDKYTALIVANDWIPYTDVIRNGNTRVGVRVPLGVDPNYFLPKVKERIDPGAYIPKK